MAKLITTQYDGTCADCGAALPVGSKARYYGRGKLYGVECHGNGRGNGGRCEDAPCCGHGGACDPATVRGDYDSQDEYGRTHLA